MNRSSLISAIRESGIGEGDSVILHSNIVILGKWEGKEGNEILSELKGCFDEVLGKNGTLVVPAYFYEYARSKQPFDIALTPPSKELGVFSNYIFKNYNQYRSINPLTSVIAIGKNAEYIVSGSTGASYGYDTHWDRLIKLKAKMCFLGVDLSAMTFIHHVEHAMCVPHVYNKYFTTPVLRNGISIELPICSQVRYLDYNIKYDLKKLTPEFEKNGLVRKSKIGRGYIRAVNFEDAYCFISEQIKNNLFYLLENVPQFEIDKIPLK